MNKCNCHNGFISIRVCCSDKSKRSYDDDYDLDDLFNPDDWPDDDDIEE